MPRRRLSCPGGAADPKGRCRRDALASRAATQAMTQRGGVMIAKRLPRQPGVRGRALALTPLPIPTPLRSLRSLRLNPLKEDRQREVVCAKFAHTIATLGINLQNLQIIQNSH